MIAKSNPEPRICVHCGKEFMGRGEWRVCGERCLGMYYFGIEEDVPRYVSHTKAAEIVDVSEEHFRVVVLQGEIQAHEFDTSRRYKIRETLDRDWVRRAGFRKSKRTPRGQVPKKKEIEYAVVSPPPRRGRPLATGRFTSRERLVSEVRKLDKQGHREKAIAEETGVNWVTVINILGTPSNNKLGWVPRRERGYK